MKKQFQLLKRATFVSLLLGMLVVGVALAATVLVDDFDNGSQRVSVSSGNQTDFVNGSPSVLGNERDIQITHVSGSNFVSLSMDFNDSNVLNFSQDSGVSGTGLVQWDGTDGAITLQANGLGSVDLTDGGTNDSIRVRITDNDSPVGITVRVYSDGGTNCSTVTYTSPGAINTTGALEDAIILFSDFTTICSGFPALASFSTVSAIEMALNGTVVVGADLTLDLFEATALRDFGDLPNTYTPATLAASHIPRSRRLGNSVDAEATNSTSAFATGDNTSGVDDENGLDPSPGILWNTTDGGSLDLNVEGCALSPSTARCRLSGWIDWNNDGDFADTDEQILNDVLVTGDTVLLFSIPVDPFNQSYFARFRICGNTTGLCNSPTATNIIDGEVEDYYWGFGPTAVTLETLSVRNTTNMVAIGVAGVLLLGGALILFRSRKPTAE